MYFLFLACAPPQLPAPAETPRQVAVSATARIEVNPDEAVISIGFSGTSVSMRASHAKAQQALANFGEAAQKLAIPTSSISAAGNVDSPNYRWDGSNRIINYTSTADITVCTKNFEQVPDIVDAAVASGATSVTVNYRSTTLPDRKKEARDLAITAAKAKAAQLAEGMGAHLGSVLQISEGMSYSQQAVGNVVVQAEFRDNPDPHDSIYAPGSTPLELSLQATFRLE